MSYLQALLEDQNKRIEPFTIDPKELVIPSDCDVLLIAGPEVDFSTANMPRSSGILRRAAS